MKFFGPIRKQNNPSGSIAEEKAPSGRITAIRGFTGNSLHKIHTMTGMMQRYEQFKIQMREITTQYRFLSATAAIFKRLCASAITATGEITQAASRFCTSKRAAATAHKGNAIIAKMAIQPQKPVKASAHKSKRILQHTQLTMKVQNTIGAFHLVPLHFAKILGMAIKALPLPGLGVTTKAQIEAEIKRVSEPEAGAAIGVESEETVSTVHEGQSDSVPVETVNIGLKAATPASAIPAFWEPPIYVDGVLLIRQVYRAEKVDKTLEVE